MPGDRQTFASGRKYLLREYGYFKYYDMAPIVEKVLGMEIE